MRCWARLAVDLICSLWWIDLWNLLTLYLAEAYLSRSLFGKNVLVFFLNRIVNVQFCFRASLIHAGDTVFVLYQCVFHTSSFQFVSFLTAPYLCFDWPCVCVHTRNNAWRHNTDFTSIFVGCELLIEANKHICACDAPWRWVLCLCDPSIRSFYMETNNMHSFCALPMPLTCSPSDMSSFASRYFILFTSF